jgi:predicted transcriptional regulator of viral defense system
MLKDIIKEVLKSKMTVFTPMDLRMLSGSTELKSIHAKIHYYVKQGDLYHIRRGFYAKDKNYEHMEFATRLFSPAYISFETVLLQEGIIFQWYETIFIASYQTKTIVCDGKTYSSRKMKSAILFDSTGIEKKDNYSIASKERAFLDIVYLHKGYHFDNLDSLDWERVYEILPIYNNKNMDQRVRKYYTAMKETL